MRKYKYSDEVKRAVREAEGLTAEGTSWDRVIMQMSWKEVFRHYCVWNGVLGYWYEALLEVVENIYAVEEGRYNALCEVIDLIDEQTK